jgi:hypothetical protein
MKPHKEERNYMRWPGFFKNCNTAEEGGRKVTEFKSKCFTILDVFTDFYFEFHF